MSIILLESLNAWWPEVILGLGGLFVLLAAAVLCPRQETQSSSTPGHKALMAGTWLVLISGALALWWTPIVPETAMFFGLIVCDPLSYALRWISLGIGAIVVLLVAGSRDIPSARLGETLGLVLLIILGLMLMAEANHLLMAYVSMELVSLSSYVLVGFLDEPRSSEASLKYLLFGALASGIMLFGMSLLFGVSGQLQFPQLLSAMAHLSKSDLGILMVALTCILAGLAFKISMVPFHFWTPDVYEGAPIAITALLSVGPKAAGLILLVRLMVALGPVWWLLQPLLSALCVITMILGNTVALVQQNVKRLLAYSTIAQVGYLLIGFIVNTRLGLEALLLYLVAYVFMNLGAFACVIAVVNDTGSESIEAFRGLSERHPSLALLNAVFLLSLAGIPPLFGFFGKFMLFGSAIASGSAWLAFAGVLNSAVALYYYVNIVRWMYLVRPERSSGRLSPGFSLRTALAICGLPTLGFGLFPGALLGLLQQASSVNLF